jgi:thiamine biosynthesis lipoprotein
MGGQAHLMVVGATADRAELAELADRAVERLAQLESRWSRFRSESEVSRLNRSGGQAIEVSADTCRLVDRAVEGWRRTEGRFDPTILHALAELGYRETFEITARTRGRRAMQPAPGCDGIEVLPDRSTVRLPRGVGFDGGGLGKGLAADVMVDELRAAGADGAMVNVGGDVRVSGESPNGDGWIIVVEDPREPDRELLRLRLDDGAVVTSSRLNRRWITSDGAGAHHLIDPSSGWPTVGIVAATAITGDAWWGEVLTKSVFVSGQLESLAEASGLLVDERGRVSMTSDLRALTR